MYYFVFLDGLVAQLVEQRIENPRVGGSIPPQATKEFKHLANPYGLAFCFLGAVSGSTPLSGHMHSSVRPRYFVRLRTDRQVYKSPHQIVRNFVIGIGIFLVESGLWLFHANDNRRVALGNFIGHNLGN